MSGLRLASEGDLPQILSIVAEAQAFLKAQGIDQWQDGYPQASVIRQDMASASGYVLEQAGDIIGIVTVQLSEELSYRAIHQGSWTTTEPYACIHRIAVSSRARGKGAADALMRGAEAIIRARGLSSVRIDTHRQNIVMQRMLQRNGYAACGVIYLADGAERIALEKAL